MPCARQRPPPVWSFSSNANEAYRKRYLREGACSFLDKASESEQLVHGVESAAHQAVH